MTQATEELREAPEIIGTPRIVETIQCYCETCGCGTLFIVEVHVRQPAPAEPDAVGTGRYRGCAACNYRSAMTIQS